MTPELWSLLNYGVGVVMGFLLGYTIFRAISTKSPVIDTSSTLNEESIGMSTLRDDERQEQRELEQIAADVEGLEGGERLIIRLLIGLTKAISAQTALLNEILAELSPSPPTTGIFTQGENMVTGTITGLLAGGTDKFFVTPIDVNGNADAPPSGFLTSVITADDPAAVVSNDPLPATSASVTANPAAVAGTSFNLNWSATFAALDGTTKTITATVAVPILKPPALDPTGGVFSQGSPAAAPVKR